MSEICRHEEEAEELRYALAAATKRAEDLQATITRIAEAQRQHCTTECIDGVWWAKGNGIVAGPQVTEQEVLLEVAEMGIAAAEQENARLREVLAWVEWFEHHESRVDLKCPFCFAYQYEGHESDCRLVAALLAKPEEKQ